jgi:hypothetical protein
MVRDRVKLESVDPRGSRVRLEEETDTVANLLRMQLLAHESTTVAAAVRDHPTDAHFTLTIEHERDGRIGGSGGGGGGGGGGGDGLDGEMGDVKDSGGSGGGGGGGGDRPLRSTLDNKIALLGILVDVCGRACHTTKSLGVSYRDTSLAAAAIVVVPGARGRPLSELRGGGTAAAATPPRDGETTRSRMSA